MGNSLSSTCEHSYSKFTQANLTSHIVNTIDLIQEIHIHHQICKSMTKKHLTNVPYQTLLTHHTNTSKLTTVVWST